MALRLVDALQPWPLAALDNGFLVDAQGLPTILITSA